jgi:hypothetical protein
MGWSGRWIGRGAFVIVLVSATACLEQRDHPGESEENCPPERCASHQYCFQGSCLDPQVPHDQDGGNGPHDTWIAPNVDGTDALPANVWELFGDITLADDVVCGNTVSDDCVGTLEIYVQDDDDHDTAKNVVEPHFADDIDISGGKVVTYKFSGITHSDRVYVSAFLREVSGRGQSGPPVGGDLLLIPNAPEDTQVDPILGTSIRLNMAFVRNRNAPPSP